MLNIPHKIAFSNVVGYLKGKSAISIARNFKGKQKNLAEEASWAGGHFVSTVGIDDEIVREYIRNQEKNDVDRAQLKLGI
jgi:putative transposase